MYHRVGDKLLLIVSVVAGIVVLYSGLICAQSFRTSGSGFLVSPDGYIITSYHVVRGAAPPITVTLSDGSRFQAELIAHTDVIDDGGTDLALLKISRGPS